MHNFKELIVWQKGRRLVNMTYQLTHSLPDNEKFGITSQIKRAVISIPANIAEGCGRTTDVELSRFLDIANGSSFELETLFILAVDIAHLQKEETKDVYKLNKEVQKMIFALKQNLNKKKS